MTLDTNRIISRNEFIELSMAGGKKGLFLIQPVSRLIAIKRWVSMKFKCKKCHFAPRHVSR